MIRVRNLAKRYRIPRVRRQDSLKSALVEFFRNGPSRLPDLEVDAVRDVSFDVERGEAVGILGTNGSGKTTLLKLLAGIIPADAGTVELGGTAAALIELGAGFHPELTGRENIVLNGTLLGMPRGLIRRKTEEIVGFAELESFADAPLRTYSSGMMLRLGFSVAVHAERDVLLVDEGLSVGDERFQSKCLRKLEDLLRSGTTVLVVSHDRDLVERWCRRALWIDRGTLRAVGDAPYVGAQYATALRDPSPIESPSPSGGGPG